MPTPADKAVPTFLIESLTLQETRLLRLEILDIIPAPLSPLACRAVSRAEVLFNSQFDDTLRVDVHTTISTVAKARAKGSVKPRVQLQVAILFQYAGLGELRRANTLPLPLAWTAVSLAYSTARGILQVKLAGTSFAQVILPIVSPQQLWQSSTTPAEGVKNNVVEATSKTD